MSVVQQSPFYAPARTELSGQRVLVVEDEFLIVSYLEDALREVGAQIVGPATTLQEALLLANTKRLDCAVLDINLNGDMVFPVADELDKRGVPFVFLTGYTAEFMPARYVKVPRYEKPFRHTVLMQGLSRLLAQASAAR
jgi:DNA-binding response OmpR family regulator